MTGIGVSIADEVIDLFLQTVLKIESRWMSNESVLRQLISSLCTLVEHGNYLFNSSNSKNVFITPFSPLVQSILYFNAWSNILPMSLSNLEVLSFVMVL